MTPIKINLCLPGMCATVYAQPDTEPAEAARRLARRYEVETGRELDPIEEERAAAKIARRIAEES